MLCGLCSRLRLGELVAALANGTTAEAVHQPSWTALCSSSSEGCQLCLLIKLAVEHAYEKAFRWPSDRVAEHHRKKDDEGGTHFVLISSSTISRHGFIYSRQAERSQAPPGEEQDLDFKGFVGRMVRPFLRVCSTSGTRLEIQDCAIAGEIDFNICKQWMNECSGSHEFCSAVADQELPTRLIDVGAADGSEEPRLVTTKGQRGRYVTLSHCWGDSTPPVTNAASFAEYLKCIPFATLPSTFSDAIMATRMLGYRHLWIDCFCIIQGDRKDWEIECARMHDTFARSAVTIAGPGAANADAGFLHKRKAPAVGPCKLEVKEESGASLGYVTVELIDPGACSNFGMPSPQRSSALSTRAWIVQEQYLSPRTLYFGTSQLYFECLTTHLFECSSVPQILVRDPDFYSRAGQHFGNDAAKNLDIWYYIVTVYSQRKLTEGNDRLPALSGLAARMQQTSGDKYLAGLWQSDLFAGLHWFTTMYYKDRKGTSTRPATIRPPSWTWAACDRHVEHRLNRHDIATGQKASIVDAWTEVPGADPFGQVTDGRLILESQLKRTALLQRPKNLPPDFWIRNRGQPVTDFYVPDPTASDRALAGVFLDDRFGDESIIQAPGGECQDVWCLLLGFHSIQSEDNASVDYVESTREFWTALALQPVPGSTCTFRRVGLVESSDLGESKDVMEFGVVAPRTKIDSGAAKSWFGDCPRLRIEVI